MALSTPQATDFDEKRNSKEYYGQSLQSTDDLRTGACCPSDSVPTHVRRVLPMLHHEITERFYGCGSPIPDGLSGLRILDLGCGTGRDAYVMAKLVGPTGFVTGIDMTDGQLDVAQRHIADQMEAFGHDVPNVRFITDEIENLSTHVEADSMDVVTSNCVLNLVADKSAVLDAVHTALRDGGEFYFSDIYADRRLPEALRTDPILHGECLGGALYVNDFLQLARMAGFADPRRVSARPISIDDEEIAERVGCAEFTSATYRLWKVPGLEGRCEDYGHVATYRGGVPECRARFELDEGHTFERNRPERVCGNTALMLSKTRFAPYFEVLGDFSEHFGDFESCGTLSAPGPASMASVGCC